MASATSKKVNSMAKTSQTVSVEKRTQDYVTTEMTYDVQQSLDTLSNKEEMDEKCSSSFEYEDRLSRIFSECLPDDDMEQVQSSTHQEDRFSHQFHPFDGHPKWTLSERNNSLYSDSLNEIMVMRAASSAGSFNSAKSSRFSAKLTSPFNRPTGRSDFGYNRMSSTGSNSPLSSDGSSQVGHSNMMSVNQASNGMVKRANKLRPIRNASADRDYQRIVLISKDDVIRVRVDGENVKKQTSGQEEKDFKSYTKPCKKGIDSSDAPESPVWMRKCKHASEFLLARNDRNPFPKSAPYNINRKETCFGPKPTTEEEIRRYHRQYLCEAFSLVILLVAIFFLLATPLLLLPIWFFPALNSQFSRAMMWLSLLLSLLLFMVAAIIGNIYWYYDSENKKLKWRLHCGHGPKHIWGSTIFQFNSTDAKKPNSDRENVNVAI